MVHSFENYAFIEIQLKQKRFQILMSVMAPNLFKSSFSEGFRSFMIYFSVLLIFFL